MLTDVVAARTGRCSHHLVRAGLLFLLSLGLHLVDLDNPRAVVFDEVYFGAYSEAYCCTKEYFFDIHPPHGKLALAASLAVSGYEGGQSFDLIGQPLEQISPHAFRWLPMLVGSLIPVLVYFVLLLLGASGLAALLGGWLVLFDNALLVQTRIHALDGMLVLATLLAISLALESARRGPRRWQMAAALASGCFAGLALGVKHTGLTAIFLVTVILWPGLREHRGIPRTVALLIVAYLGLVAAYLAGWYLHFAILVEPGSGDAWGEPSGNFLWDVVETHRKIFAANLGLHSAHPDASAWWGWPLMWRPVYYYAGEGAGLYLVGNPVVWWGSLIFLLYFLLSAISRIVRQGLQAVSLQWLPMGLKVLSLAYLVSFVPYAFIPRIMFLYHYLPALVFAVMLVVLLLEHRGHVDRERELLQQPWLIVGMTSVALGFAIFMPVTYPGEWPEYLRAVQWIIAELDAY